MAFGKCLLVAGFCWAMTPAAAEPNPSHVPMRLEVHDVTRVGVSPPARDIPAPFRRPPGRAIKKLFRLTLGGPSTPVADQVTQSSAPVASPSSTSTNFEGIAVGDNQPLYAPPDENLAVGPSHIVQTVNMSFAVYDKSGILAPGFPKPMTALYAGTGGACETQSQSDPIVRYDRQADRWILSYLTFQALFLITESHMCVAVSRTGDPLGAYWLYDARFDQRLQDYPKFALWPDGWYSSANSFIWGFSLEGSNMCAWERDKLLLGDTAGKVICVVTLNGAYSGLLPSDWDGATPPPPGSPNFFTGLYSTSQLMMFKMKPNYANPPATQVTGPIYVDVSPFNLPCGGGDCIPQKDSTQLLASVGDRAMYRLAYRNFGTHESLVVNHSVGTANTVGIRWYEIRSPNATPTIHQQGTYAPDSTYRWMGSMAMDKSGNIAVGYSRSGPGMFPGIFYTGREAGDALGTLRAEQTIWAGSGSQTPGDAGSNRWGDYSSIETDPGDDCTFWYTSQYLPASGTFNWRTRIASFKFDNCGASKTDTTTTITSQTPSATVTGQPYTVSVTVAPSGATGTVTVDDGAGANCVATLGGGGAGSCALTANTAINRTLTATYSGDASFNGSPSDPVSHTVNKADTTTTITGDPTDPSIVNEAYTINFQVTVNSPGSGTLTGLVTIGDGTGGSCTAAVGLGVCVMTSTSAGDKTLTANYAGDLNFNGSSDTEQHTVNPSSGGSTAGVTALDTGRYTGKGKNKSFEMISTFTRGDQVIIRATVKDSGGQPIPGATVSFSIAGPQNANVTSGPSDAGGVAEASWQTQAPNKKGNGGTQPGSYTATVTAVSATGYTWDGTPTFTSFTLQ